MAENNGNGNGSATTVLVTVVIILIIAFAFWFGMGRDGVEDGGGNGINVELNAPSGGDEGGGSGY